MTAVVVRLLKVALKCKVFVSFYLWTKTNPSLPVAFFLVEGFLFTTGRRLGGEVSVCCAWAHRRPWSEAGQSLCIYGFFLKKKIYSGRCFREILLIAEKLTYML